MADDKTQRSYRAPDGAGRISPASGNDPLAELARLIGQSDPFGEYGHNAGQSTSAAPAAAAPTPEPSAGWVPAPPVPGYPPRQPESAPAAYQSPHEAYPAQHQPYQDAYQAPPYAEADLHHVEQRGHAPEAQDGDYDAYIQQTSAYAPQAQADPYTPAYDDPNLAAYASEEDDYYDDAPPRRRMGILAIAAVFALAVLGTAGAFGYRALFGSSFSGPPPIIKADTTPSKIVPVKKDSTAKLIQDRAPAAEKIVTREEKPIDLQSNSAGTFPSDQANASAGSVQPPMLGSGVIGGEPRKVHTIVIRPDQLNAIEPASAAQAPAVQPPAVSTTTPSPSAAPPPKHVADVQPAAAATHEPVRHEPAVTHKTAPHEPVVTHKEAARRPVTRRASPRHRPIVEAVAPAQGNAPLSLNPDAPVRTVPIRTAPMRTAAIPRQIEPQATAAGGSYAVQVTSRRSEAEAKADFRRLQAKYPTQLGGHQPLIRRVDLGQKGVYYRAMVGPFASAEAASRACSRIKAAGGSCFVQRI